VFNWIYRFFASFNCAHESTNEEKRQCFTFDVCNKCGKRVRYNEKHSVDMSNFKCGDILICKICGGVALTGHKWENISDKKIKCMVCRKIKDKGDANW